MEIRIMTASNTDSFSNSEGHVFASSSWLDSHFLAMQPEYEEMLCWVGVPPGWHVLDAACGGGSFLPLLLELVGATGTVSALDLDPENVHMVEAQAQQNQWSSRLSTDVGSILDLPYDDRCFDAVWCANTMQYLSEDDVHLALKEFRRVVRPGGLIAIKDYDVTGQQFQPLPPALCLHRYEAMARAGSLNDQGLLRIMHLPRYLRAAGLIDIRQKPTMMLRFPPLRAVEKAFFVSALKVLAAQAEHTDLPHDERELWQQLGDVESPDHILNSPDFYYRAIQTVFVGRVP
jgi:SAM-dependent methyltransferase